MNAAIRNCILKGYQETKESVDSFDEHKIINKKDIKSLLPSIRGGLRLL